MRKTFTIFVLGAALAWTGCATDGGGDGPELLRDDIPDPPEGGAQIVSQIFEIPPNEEVFMCMKVPFEVTERMLIQDSAIYQAENGHHTMVFYSNNSAGVDPEPHECDGFEMTDVRIITTGTANGIGLTMPEGVVFEVPADVEVWIQSHYINTTSEPRQVQDVINLELKQPDQVTEIASTFTHLDLTFSLPPGEQTTSSIECEIPAEMNVPFMIPHMHEWGAEYGLDVTRGDEVVWSWTGEWYANLRDDIPFLEFDPPLLLQQGDKLRTTCTWQNTESHTMLFPEEMCATFFPYYPGDGQLLACDENGDIFAP